mgnify:FL=1
MLIFVIELGRVLTGRVYPHGPNQPASSNPMEDHPCVPILLYKGIRELTMAKQSSDEAFPSLLGPKDGKHAEEEKGGH